MNYLHEDNNQQFINNEYINVFFGLEVNDHQGPWTLKLLI